MKGKWMHLVLAAVLTTSLAACSQNANSGKGTENTQQTPVNSAEEADPLAPYEETVTFTLGRQGVAGNNLPAGDTLESNQFLKYVEDKLNIKVQYDFSVEDGEAYKQKVNLAIASSQIPDVMIVDENQYKQLADADMLADLTEAYDKYASPLIKQYYASYGGRVLDAVKKDGKILALPDTNIAGNNQLLWVREDWLKTLNLQAPSTLDEVAAVAKAFKEQDPDQNGTADTVGLLGDPNLTTDGAFFTFDPIFAAYGAYPGYWLKDESGAVMNGSIAPEMKDALGKLREMYAAGLIDEEFVTRKWNDNAAQVASGKAGILFAPWFAGWMLSDSVKNDPKADWIALTAPLDGNGKRNLAVSKPSGQYLVVRKGFEHPEAIVKTLSVQYEGLRLKDPAAAELYKGLGVSWLNWPLNLHLNNENTVYEGYLRLKSAVEAKDSAGLPADQVPTYDSIVKNLENPKQDIAAYANYLAYYIGGSEVGSDKLNKIEPVFYGQTETMAKKGTNLTKLENETFLKIITGNAPLESFDDFVAQWKKQGGDEITQEVEQETGQ